MVSAIDPHDGAAAQRAIFPQQILRHGVLTEFPVLCAVKFQPLIDVLAGKAVFLRIALSLAAQQPQIAVAGRIILVADVRPVENGLGAGLLDTAIKVQHILVIGRAALPVGIDLH